MSSQHHSELLFECYGLGVVQYDSRRQYPTARCIGLRTRPQHPPLEISQSAQKNRASLVSQGPEGLKQHHEGTPDTKRQGQEGLGRRVRRAFDQAYSAVCSYYTRFSYPDATSLNQKPKHKSPYLSSAGNTNPSLSRSLVPSPFLIKTDYCLGRTTVYASKLQSPQCLGLHLSIARHTNVVNPNISRNHEVEPVTMEQRTNHVARTGISAAHQSLADSINDDADDNLDDTVIKAGDAESVPSISAVSLSPVIFAQRVGLIASQVGQPLYRHIILRPRETSLDTFRRVKAIYERSAEAKKGCNREGRLIASVALLTLTLLNAYLLRRSRRILFSFTASPVELSTHTGSTASSAKSSSSRQ